MMSNLRLLNPDFEWLFFDDDQVEAFIEREVPEYRTVFESFKFPIQRYDFFRYLAVYTFGGFYFDLDVLLASGLSCLLEFDCVFPFEGIAFSQLLRRVHNMDWQIGNYAFGATPRHPFLKAIIDNCVRSQRDRHWSVQMMRGTPPLSKEEFTVLNSTGPGLVSRTFAENVRLAEMVTILFPDGDVCDTSTWNQFGTLGVHLMDSSWRPRYSSLRKFCARFSHRWTLNKLLKQSRELGTARHPPQKSTTLTSTVADHLNAASDQLL